jgi:hypothetical protein
VIATYAAIVAVCAASLAIGQAAIALCGARRWSWLSPAVGLALLCAICWATVRLPGHGAVSALVVLAATVASVLFLKGRVEGGGEALGSSLPVAAVALLAASLPFAVEGHFGILGTGFNPDMSQHLFAADHLAHGAGSQLQAQGYPLGSHAIVVALNKGLDIGLVQGFTGLTVATAVLAPLTALAAFTDTPRTRRIPAALLVGLPYLVASYYAQGAFKETTQALLVLAFTLSLRESTRTWNDLPLRFVPAALIAVGSVYVYSFPGLTWLAGIAAVFAALQWRGSRQLASRVGGVGEGSAAARRPLFRPNRDLERPTVSPGGKPSNAADPSPTTGPARLRPLSLAGIVFLVGALPELGRMLDFRHFETFDPSGPGLGNLFGQISPFEALGIWPSGDFRLAPGDGAVPAVVYYLGAAFATALLLYGLARCARRRERAILAGTIAVAALYAAARIGGTPYTAAKALEIAAPLLTLTIVGPFAWTCRLFSAHMGRLATARPPGIAATAFVLVAAGCSLLAFANAPVGPTSYSPALTGLRPLVASGSVLVLAPDSLLVDEHGERYIAWELRGGRVCIEPASAAGGRPPSGIRFFVAFGDEGAPPFRDLAPRRRVGPYLLWERLGPLGGPSQCPLVAVRQARAGAE